MDYSLFTRIFFYRQRDTSAPLENFITEIFAFCLQTDQVFRKDFFTKLLGKGEPKGGCTINTQNSYEGYGRPDLEINYPNECYLIECKIEASERPNQLADYALILKNYKQGIPNKHVIFLTKYYEHKVLQHTDIHLHLLRWFEVYELITEQNSQVTNQLKQFLKDQGMEKIKNFTIQDLLAMRTIPETITKMDELLEQFKPEFDKEFGGFSKDSSRSTRLPYSLYINYVQLSFNKVPYHILIGFFWWWERYEIPYVGLSVELPSKKMLGSELVKILDAELIEKLHWDFEDNGRFYNYNALKPLTDFITMENDNVPEMKKFIQSQLNTLYKLRDKYPKLFRK